MEAPKVPRRPQRKKRLKDSNAPKKPPSAYFLWLSRNRSELVKEAGSSRPSVIAAFASNRWKESSDEVHVKWKAKAEKLKDEYRAAMLEYEQTDESKAFKEALQAEKEQHAKKRQAPSPMSESEVGAKSVDLSTDELLQELHRRINGQDRKLQSRVDQLEQELSSSQEQVQTLKKKLQKLQQNSGQARVSPASSIVSEQSKLDEHVSYDGGSPFPIDSTGYELWLSKRWDKLVVELGPCPDAVIRIEARKRWNNLSEEKRQRWADKSQQAN